MKQFASEHRNGASAVEFAILLPLLVFMFVIGVDFARVFYYSQIVENAARNGAYYASDPKAPAYSLYGGTTATTNAQALAALKLAAVADAGDMGASSSVTVSSNPTNLYPMTAVASYPTDASGNYYVQVTVSWTFGTITSYAGVPKSVTLTRTVQMRQPQ